MITKEQIEEEGKKYSDSLDFTEDRGLSEKGRKRVKSGVSRILLLVQIIF